MSVPKIRNSQIASPILTALKQHILTICLAVGFAGFAEAAKPTCGDGICQGNEARTCPVDCEASPPPPPPPPADSVPSTGCETGLTGADAKAGRAYVRQLLVPSNPTTNYEIRLPSNYEVNQYGGLPVLIYLHGWGGSHRSLPASFARHGKNNGYIIVTPTGYGDGGNNSWNGFRSARLPGCPKDGYSEADCDAGPFPSTSSPQPPSTCVDLDNARHDYCYDDPTGAQEDCPRWVGPEGTYQSNTWGPEFDGDYTCYWTTRRDSVAQIAALLDEVEEDYCVDRSMIWATGCSNGGMFVYELAKDPRTADRFAGFMPQVGAPHPGFTQFSPTSPAPPGKFFMGFWGSGDNTVPGRSNFPELFGDEVALDTDFNGWLYMTARSITSDWAEANGFTDESGVNVAPPQPYDASGYSSSLECAAWRRPDDGNDAEIVECFFNGGHSCPGFGGMPQMMWDFARSHRKLIVP